MMIQQLELCFNVLFKVEIDKCAPYSDLAGYSYIYRLQLVLRLLHHANNQSIVESLLFQSV